MKLVYNSCMALLCVAMLSITNLFAQGQKIPFQGTLYQSGTAVNGTVNITFTIDDPSWTETHDNVNVTQGVYAVVLGETTAFPEGMFAAGTAPQLTVAVGGTEVAQVPLHAPFINAQIVDDNLPSTISRTFDEDGTEFNGLSMVVDGAGDAQTSAFEGVAQSDTQNTGVEGFAVSGSGNSAIQYGLYGQATGEGTGTHRGVMGYGAGAGKYNHGVKGYAAGDGNGDEGQGFGEGSVNFGVEGNATGNAWNNTGVEGSNFGTEGVWNFGVHGISNAGSGTEVENHGVAGRAFGPGKNYGVFGQADGGAENYAGFFEGDVNINGQLMVNGDAYTSGNINADGGYVAWGDNDSHVNVQAGGISLGQNSYDNGIVMNYDNVGGPVFEMYSGSNQTVNINGASGEATFQGWAHVGNNSVVIGNQYWDPNGGEELGTVYLNGTADGLSDQGRATIQVRNDGAGSYGHMSLRNYTDNGGGGPSYTVELNGENGDASFAGQVFSNSFANPRAELLSNWGNDGQGALILKDANESWMIQATVNDDGASNYSGTITAFNSQNNFLTEMGGDGYISIHEQGVGDVINLNKDGNIYASNSISTDGEINSPTYNTTSDARFKKNVKSIDGALAKTQQLNGYTYNWNKLAEKQKGITTKEQQVGVLAQELEAVFPQLVKTDEEGYKSVNYAAMTAVLIEAVKELSAQVGTLQNENAEMKAELTKVDELEIKIDLIQKLLAKQTLEASKATVSR